MVVILLIPAGWFGGRALLTYNGYCFEQGRYLTDEERIRDTVRTVLAIYPRITYAYDTLPKSGYEVVMDKSRCCGEGDRSRFDGSKGGTGFNTDQLILYRDMDEFLALNPGCCTFARDGLYGEVTRSEFSSKITGRSAGFASVKFRVRYRDATGNVQEKFSGWSSNYSNCGKPVSPMFD